VKEHRNHGMKHNFSMLLNVDRGWGISNDVIVSTFGDFLNGARIVSIDAAAILFLIEAAKLFG